MANQRSIGQMVSDVTTDLSSIVHNEIALAKLEIKSDITKGGKGAVFLVVAGGAGEGERGREGDGGAGGRAGAVGPA